MAYGNPNSGYYPDDGPGMQEQAPEGGEGGDKGQPGDEKKMDGETALLPKSILAGKEFKPGDEVVLKIVHMYEDEVEVAYAPEKPGEGEEEETQPEGGESEMDRSQNKLSSMAE